MSQLETKQKTLTKSKASRTKTISIPVLRQRNQSESPPDSPDRETQSTESSKDNSPVQERDGDSKVRSESLGSELNRGGGGGTLNYVQLSRFELRAF